MVGSKQNAPNEMPPNFDVGKMIDGMKKMKATVQSGKKPETLTSADIKQLRDSASTHQQQGNFQKAVETLQTVLDHIEGWDKLEPTIDQAECFLSLKKISEAEVVCDSIASIVDVNRSSRMIKKSRDDYDKNIKKLALKFVDVKECDCAISLARCRFQFVKNHYDGESRLIKLDGVGWLMGEICEEMKKQNKQKQIKEQLPFMEEILEFMENTNDTDLKIKCEQITWFLKRFGFCCNKAADWSKSITINKYAISLMRIAFHVDASRYRVFGIFHNNMGVALERTNQLFEAKTAYTKAIEIYNTVRDWKSEEDKSSNISVSMIKLKGTEEKISENQN